jgi:hypothetical protein
MTVLEMQTSRGTTDFAFDPGSHLLRRFSVVSPHGFLRWEFRYGPPLPSVTYAPPSYAKLVPALSGKVEPPKYADAKARRIATACVRALDRLRSAEFEVDTEGRRFHVWFSNAMARENRGPVDWGFENRNLWIVDRSSGKSWSGRASSFRIAAVLNALNFPTEAFVQQMVQGRNPMRPILVPGASVRDVGTVKWAGATCDILEVSASGILMSVCVRQRDHLPAHLTSDFIDNSGQRIGGSARSIRWYSVGKRISSAVFRSRIAAGAQVLKLPKTR